MDARLPAATRAPLAPMSPFAWIAAGLAVLALEIAACLALEVPKQVDDGPAVFLGVLAFVFVIFAALALNAGYLVVVR